MINLRIVDWKALTANSAYAYQKYAFASPAKTDWI